MPAVAVRAAAVLLTVFGGGLGVAIYLVLWAVLPVSAAPAVIAESVEGRRQPRFSVFHWLVLGGIVLVTGGISLASDAGSWFTDARYAVPALAIAAGAFVAWYQLDDPTGRRRGRTRARWVGVVQVVVGVALAMVGVVVIVTQGQGTRGVVNGALAGAAVLAGAVVIAAPFALRLYRGLQREQAEPMTRRWSPGWPDARSASCGPGSMAESPARATAWLPLLLPRSTRSRTSTVFRSRSS